MFTKKEKSTLFPLTADGTLLSRSSSATAAATQVRPAAVQGMPAARLPGGLNDSSGLIYVWIAFGYYDRLLGAPLPALVGAGMRVE